jgi:hypothetical protein
VAAAVVVAGWADGSVQCEPDVLIREGGKVQSEKLVLAYLLCTLHFALSACSDRVRAQANVSTTVVLYEGARFIAGDGSASIADSAFLVEGGTITRLGKKGDWTAPAGARRINLTGKTVMPALINAHGHPGFQRGLTYSADNFTRETIIDDLNRALYFGVVVFLAPAFRNARSESSTFSMPRNT